MLEVKNLRKTIGQNEILKGVDLSLKKGGVMCVLGPSGSGKTTLLRCLNFLERADEGEMTFLGERYALPSVSRRTVAAYRRHTAFVFQSYNLFSNKTALQNVAEGLIVARRMPKAEAYDRSRAALERVGLEDKGDSYPSQLSGGQQQRVAIARAVVGEPDIIFFDEPTSALDPELIGGVLSVIRKLAEDGMTMMIVTHELHFARNVSTDVLFMDGGRVLTSAPAEDFFTNPSQERVQAFFSTLNREE